MKMYVQSASQERDYYWVEVSGDTGTGLEVLASSPHSCYKELLGYIDPETPSLLIAMVPPKQLLLLVKGFISQRRDRRGRSIENNFLLIFDQKEERSVRVFAAMLLPGIQDDQQIEYSSTHSKWLKQINRCIIDGSLGTFHIDPTLLEVVNTIIKEGEHQASSQRASAYPSKEVALAMNSLQRREELADLLYEFPLPLRESQREIIPLVVVTGNEAPETLIRAGAWRILTLLSKYEHWYTFPKPRQNTLRFIVLIGAGVSCAIILALVILLVKKW